jgi:GNAT superfamily N-acetyltransferase
VSVIDVQTVTAKRWNDVVDLFERIGPRGGIPVTRGCWCQYWNLRGRAYDLEAVDENRARLEAEIRDGAAHALLAYVDGTPVGWCRLGPRESFDRLEHAPRLARVDVQPVWSVVCFYLHPTARRSGVTTALLDGAIEYARSRGATVVEAYPVRSGHMSLDAYTGYLPMYLAAGFEVVRDAGRRIIVRKRVA